MYCCLTGIYPIETGKSLASEQLNILLIKDEEDVSEIIGGMIKSLDYKIKQTSKTALNYLDKKYLDLIIMDCGLPDIEGTKLYDLINGKRKDIPVTVRKS